MTSQTLFARKGFSLERLQAFVTIAESKSISRAAPGNAVRQSQLSRQITELEAALEVALFNRARRGFELTAAGQRLLLVTREFSLGLSDLRRKEPLPELALGAGDSVLQWLVLPRLSKLAALAHFKLTAMTEAQLTVALEEHQLDLAVMAASEVGPALRTATLGKVEYGVFSLRSRTRRLPLVAITGEPRLRNAQLALGQPTLECETFPQLAQAVRSGQFRGVLPLFAETAFPGATPDIEFAPPLKEHSDNLVLAWRPRLDQVRPDTAEIRRVLTKVLREALSPT